MFAPFAPAQPMPLNPLALIFSGIALAVSITTAWLTLFRRGNLRMTQPALVGFLYDLPAGDPKVFFRALLYATGKRGQIVESMYLKVGCRGSTQIFNFWMYGETTALMIGSGLRVGEEGVAFNHHFLPPKGSLFQFLAGDYQIEVCATLVNRQESPILLSKLSLPLSQEQAAALKEPTAGVLYNWGPDAQSYHAQIDTAPRQGISGAGAGA